MARPLRIKYEGAVYHITARGNEQRSIYEDQKDRLIFFDILYEVKKRYNFFIHAYCLMDNHYHLIIETPEANLSNGMRQINGMYTQFYNRKYSRVGHLFQGRYKSILIQKDSHLLEACRYVVLNPIRANIVKYPWQYTWSSYNATYSMKKVENFLTVDWVLSQFDNKKNIAQESYKKFILSGIGLDSIHNKVKNQVIFGNDNFVEEIGKHIKGKEKIKEITRKERYINRPQMSNLFYEEAKLNKKKKVEKIKELIYKWGYTQKEVADYLNVHYSTISKILARQ